VLVVGAGPAGSVASLVCAKNGFETILAEKNSRVGGHTKTKLDASTGAELIRVVGDLGLKTENEVYASRWHPPSGNYFLLKSSSPEYFFKRGPDEDSFEVSTVHQAVEAGCSLQLKASVKGVKEGSEKIEKVVLEKEGERVHIKPKILVLGDGGRSIFHRFVHKVSDASKKVGYGVTGADFSDPSSSNIYFDAELLPGGYFYVITGRSGLSSACVVLDSRNMRKPVKEYFQEFLAEHKDVAGKIKSPVTCFTGEGHIFELERYVYKNMLVIGDAAGLIDPFFGYGMTSAIVSGYYAGEYIKKAVEEKNPAALADYDSEIKKRFDKRLSRLYQKVFETLTNEDLELIAEILNDLDKKVDMDAIVRQLSGGA